MKEKNKQKAKESAVKPKFWFCILLAVFIIAVYSNVFKSPFVFDDEYNIINDHAHIRGLSYYTSPEKWFKWRAVTNFTFALDYKLGKFSTLPYHLTNIFIHIINSLLVYLVSLTLFQTWLNRSIIKPVQSVQTMSAFAALIFAGHPVQTMAVTYITQRYASMSVLFYLLSVFLYLKARQAEQKSSGALCFAGSLVSGLLALLSKENAASLPAAIVLVEFLVLQKPGEGRKKILTGLGIAFIFWILFAGYTISNAKSNLTWLNQNATIGLWDYLCTQFNVLVIYLRILVLPVNQNMDYNYRYKAGFMDGATPLAFLVLAVLIAVAIINYRKRPVVTFSISWYFIAHSVESMMPLTLNAMYEYRLYLPMFGFAILAVYYLELLLRRSKKLAAVPLILVLVLGAATFRRNFAWKSEWSVWQDVYEKSPDNPRALVSLGFLFGTQGKHGQEIEYYQKAIQLKPDYAKAHYNLGVALADKGELGEAENHFAQAVRFEPYNISNHINLGMVLKMQKKYDEAEKAFSDAIKTNPGAAELYYHLGLVLGEHGKNDSAIRQFSEALRIQQDFGRAHYAWGNVLLYQNDLEGAKKHFSEAIRINPDDTDSHNNLGVTLLRQGKKKEAVKEFQEALRINPGFDRARQNIEMVKKYF